MSSITTPGLFDPNLLAAQRVDVTNLEKVRAYLSKHSDLIDLLVPLCQRSRDEFGPAAELALEVYRDPETPDEYLTLYVRQTPYAHDIIERIDKISAALADDLSSKSGWILVTTDLHPPRG